MRNVTDSWSTDVTDDVNSAIQKFTGFFLFSFLFLKYFENLKVLLRCNNNWNLHSNIFWPIKFLQLPLALSKYYLTYKSLKLTFALQIYTWPIKLLQLSFSLHKYYLTDKFVKLFFGLHRYAAIKENSTFQFNCLRLQSPFFCIMVKYDSLKTFEFSEFGNWIIP